MSKVFGRIIAHIRNAMGETTSRKAKAPKSSIGVILRENGEPVPPERIRDLPRGLSPGFGDHGGQ